MSFEEIITMMKNATDYMDLYDAASYIVDDDLRVDVEQLIGQCEDDGDDVETAYSIVTSDLLDMRLYDLNESKDIEEVENEKKSLQDYVDDINNASNDKDMVNILDDMENNKNIDKELASAVRQLFRNNRFMPLNQKTDTLLKFIQENSDEKVDELKQESLTEAVEPEIEDSDIDNKDNDEKENKDIDEAVDEAVDEAQENSKEKDSLELTTLDTIKKRIGQQFDVGDFNSLIQTTFNQYNQVFLMTSDLYSMDLDKTQTIEVKDDEITYVLSFDIIDIDSGIIELTDVSEKGV